MGKNTKLCHNPHTPFPWEREGSLMAKSLSPRAKTKKKWLNRTLLGSPFFKIYEQDFAFQKSSFSVKITANHADFAHFAHSPHELREIRYKIHPH